LTRALGIDEAVAVDSWEVEAVTGDRYLLCSDGLFNEGDGPKVAATLRRFDDPVDAARELVRLANGGGGRDHITCVVVHVVGGAEGAEGRAARAEATDADATRPTRAVVDDEEDDQPRARRFTWRVALFIVALLALVAVVAGALGWYARNTYYVTFQGEEVTI